MSEQDTTIEITTEIVEYSTTAAALGELRAKYQDVIFPVETTKGMTDAKAARKELRDLRTGLEKLRKEIKAPALRRCQLIDTEAKDITAQLTKLEDPIDEQIKIEEERKEREKQERERVERERAAEIKGRIDAIRALPGQSVRDTAEDLAATIKDLTDFEITSEVFAEFSEEATATKAQAIEELTGLMDAAKTREAAEALVAQERAELERQKADADEKAKAEAKRLEEEAARLQAERAEFERQRAEFEALKQSAMPPVMLPGGLSDDDLTDTMQPDCVVAKLDKDGFMFPGSESLKQFGNEFDSAILNSLSSSVDDQPFDANMAIELGTIPAGTVVTEEVITKLTVIHQHQQEIIESLTTDDTAETEVEAVVDADTLVSELAGYTAMQFIALSNKVAAVAENSAPVMKNMLIDYASDLRNIAEQVASGDMNAHLKTGNWIAMADADKEMALASHACVSLIVGDAEIGPSVLRAAE